MLVRPVFVAMINELPLDSPLWNELSHAYGSAGDIPALLIKLESFPESNDYSDEPWFSLWSALAHQGDVYPASFAAVPHVVRILASNPSNANHQFFLFRSCVEIDRHRRSMPIPTELESDYLNSLSRLHSLAVDALARRGDLTVDHAVNAAIAVTEGRLEVAAVLLDDGSLREA
jgi:hypothetical protein